MAVETDLTALPSYAHLNRAQRRAFILRDNLKYLDSRHLDTYILGIELPEPPNYRSIDGKTEPAFSEVALKKDAKKLDLGNVRFHERDRTFIKRAFLIIDAGNCELKETKPLAQSDDDLLSVPIEAYSVESTVPLFLAKYAAIEKRRHQINELRRVAFSGVTHHDVQVRRGKSLTKLHTDSFDADGSIHKPQPRTPGDPIPRHVANRHKRIGFSSIPNSFKTEVMSKLPEPFKANFFDIIVKNAFPHFDNLMMAAWNVVSLFSGTGSEENELLRAVSQLDVVLREFDGYYTAERKPKEEEIEPENHLTPASRNSPHPTRAGSRLSTPAMSRASAVLHHPAPISKQSAGLLSKPHHALSRLSSRVSPKEEHKAHIGEGSPSFEGISPPQAHAGNVPVSRQHTPAYPPHNQPPHPHYPPHPTYPAHRDQTPRYHPYARGTVERPPSSTAYHRHPPYPPSYYNDPYSASYPNYPHPGYPHPHFPYPQHMMRPPSPSSAPKNYVQRKNAGKATRAQPFLQSSSSYRSTPVNSSPHSHHSLSSRRHRRQQPEKQDQKVQQKDRRSANKNGKDELDLIYPTSPPGYSRSRPQSAYESIEQGQAPYDITFTNAMEIDMQHDSNDEDEASPSRRKNNDSSSEDESLDAQEQQHGEGHEEDEENDPRRYGRPYLDSPHPDMVPYPPPTSNSSSKPKIHSVSDSEDDDDDDAASHISARRSSPVDQPKLSQKVHDHPPPNHHHL